MFFIKLILWGLILLPTQIDRILPIENFEGNRAEDRKWTLLFQSGAGVRGYLTVSSLETAAVPASVRYLNINFFGKRENGLRIAPPAPLPVPGYVREIRFWVFGFGQGDDLYIDLTDNRRRFHRIFVSSLNFKGWKQLKIVPGNKVFQRPRRITGKTQMEIRGFYLVPHYQDKAGLCRIYIDEIEAVVRDYFLTPKVQWD